MIRTPELRRALSFQPELGTEMKENIRTSSSVASSAETRLVPATHVVAAVHGTRTVLLDPLRGRYYGLDEVGGRIWALTQDRPTTTEIVDVLAQEFEVTRPELEQDVVEVLQSLKSKGLVGES